MQEKSLIKQNILKYLAFKGITQYKFYQITGITRGVLTQNNGMSEENTSRFLDCFTDVNPEWLLTGRGEMLKDSVPETAPPAPPDLLLAQREIIDLQKDKIKLLEQAIQDQRQQVEALKKELAHCHSLAMRPGSVR